MKPGIAIAVLVAAVCLAAPSIGRTPSCHLPAGRVVAADHVAELLSVPSPRAAALFACIRRTSRKIALDDGFSDARLAGRWVAWQRPGRGRDWLIAVHDLRTGRERLVDGRVAARSLRVSARGSIVWAQRERVGAPTPLYANDVRSGGRLLDGGEVDARSVRLVGGRVTWRTSDGGRHSARVR